MPAFFYHNSFCVKVIYEIFDRVIISRRAGSAPARACKQLRHLQSRVDRITARFFFPRENSAERAGREQRPVSHIYPIAKWEIYMEPIHENEKSDATGSWTTYTARISLVVILRHINPFTCLFIVMFYSVQTSINVQSQLLTQLSTARPISFSVRGCIILSFWQRGRES